MYIPDFSEIMAVAHSRGADSDAPDLWNDLVLDLPIAAGGGTTAYDVSGYGNEGTLTAMEPATDWVTTEHGFAIDGEINDYVAHPRYPQIADRATFSILLDWRSADPNFLLDGREAVGELGISIYHRNTPRFEIWENNDAALATASTAGLTNNWHFWSFVWQGDGLPGKIYLDGADVSANQANQTALGQGDKLYLASRYNVTGIPSFRSALYLLHDCALSPSTIQQLHDDPHAMHRLRQKVYASVAVGFGGQNIIIGGGIVS